MQPVRFPYRWLPRTAWANIRFGFWDIIGGIRNVIRWAPVIWFDADFDWEYLASIMEYKLLRMAYNAASYWHHEDATQAQKEMRICARLLRRLQEDDYCVRADNTFERGREAADHAMAASAKDLKLLGKILGSRLNCWWS